MSTKDPFCSTGTKKAVTIFSGRISFQMALYEVLLITALSQEPDRLPILTVIDEPELGLHPYAITVIAALMRSLSSVGQLIASTQSTTLLNQFDPSDVLVIDRKDGESIFTRPDPTALENWLTDYTMGELWEKNVIGAARSELLCESTSSEKVRARNPSSERSLRRTWANVAFLRFLDPLK